MKAGRSVAAARLPATPARMGPGLSRRESRDGGELLVRPDAGALATPAAAAAAAAAPPPPRSLGGGPGLAVGCGPRRAAIAAVVVRLGRLRLGVVAVALGRVL